MNRMIEQNAALVISNWDNRSGEMADFECKDGCPTPAESCENSKSVISDFTLSSWGSTEDKPEVDDDEDEDNGEPAIFHPFIAYAESNGGESEYFVKGLDGRYLETDNDMIMMGSNNRAWVTDFEYDDGTEWAFKAPYLGGSLSFEVDLSGITCDERAGAFLVEVDDDECSWNAQPSG